MQRRRQPKVEESEQVEEEREEEEDRVGAVVNTAVKNQACQVQFLAQFHEYTNFTTQQINLLIYHRAGQRQQGDQVDTDGGGVVDGVEGQGGLHQLLE